MIRPATSMRESKWGFPIIDFHCHFPLPDESTSPLETAYVEQHGEHKLQVLQRNWRWYQEQWWSAYSFPFPETEEPSAQIQAERWDDEVEASQLEAAVFLTGGGNDSLARAIKGHDRFVGFAHHDPFSHGAAEELRRAVTTGGLRGYKVIAPALRGAIDDESLFPLWQVAEELNIPVLLHFGVLDGGGGTAAHRNINPLVLHDVAKAFPETTFVVPHLGCGYPGELLQLCWACRNVMVDTSGNNEWIRWMPYSLTLADLVRRFFETIGPERILFGSDSAHFPRGLVRSYYDEQVRIIHQLGLSDDERHLFFAGNAARLLHLEER